VAPAFLAWLALPRARRWLDVGCGTGALCAAIVDECAPAVVTGVEPSAGFLATARAALAGKVDLREGSAAAIPLPDRTCDVVVSGLVLNFTPDPRAALAEMKRVATPEATIAAYVWDYAGKMELMRYFWDAAGVLDAQAQALDEGVRFPLCRPEALEALFGAAALARIEVQAIDIATPFADFDDYWQPFLGGQGPAPAYAMALAADARERLRERLRQSLPTAPDGSIALTARAWAVRGTVPE
jgi:SAM-dependent methyltransferase